MWYFVLSFIAFLIVTWFIYKWAISNRQYPNWEDFWFATIIFWLVGGICIPIIGFGAVLPMTTGIASEYLQNGEAVGYVTHFREKGLIWKTWEGRYLAGVGKQTAVGGSYSFSVVDNKVVKQLQAFVGKDTRIKMTYDCWWLMPYRMGDTDCLVTKVVELE
jgi:hypothetical protein